MSQKHRITAPSELLPWLFATFPEAKKTTVKQWLKHGSVLVNKKTVTQFNYELMPGDLVTIEKGSSVSPASKGPGLGLKLLYEDADIIVVDKPAGLLSIANSDEDERTTYFALTEYVRRGGHSPWERVWIVHRLDRETSGVMIFARKEEVKYSLQENWDEAEKIYQAVVLGRLPAQKGTFDSYLDESNPYRVREVRRPTEETRRAITHYRVIREGGGRQLVELKLETGRRHQIRVHLTGAGCPIIGDEKYDQHGPKANRMALHACSLTIPHPVSGQMMTFSSRLPMSLGRMVP